MSCHELNRQPNSLLFHRAILRQDISGIENHCDDRTKNVTKESQHTSTHTQSFLHVVALSYSCILFARRKLEAKGQVSEYKTLIIDHAPLSFGLMFSQEGTLHWSCKTWRLVKSAQLCSNMRLMNRTDSPSALLVIIGPQVWRHGWGSLNMAGVSIQSHDFAIAQKPAKTSKSRPIN